MLTHPVSSVATYALAFLFKNKEPEEHKPEEFHPPQEEKPHKVPAFLQSKQPRRKPSDDEYQSFESESELSFKETIVPQIRKLSRPKGDLKIYLTRFGKNCLTT